LGIGDTKCKCKTCPYKKWAVDFVVEQVKFSHRWKKLVDDQGRVKGLFADEY